MAIEQLCKDCEHKKVCCFKDEFERKMNEANNINKISLVDSPIGMSMTCSSYYNNFVFKRH